MDNLLPCPFCGDEHFSTMDMTSFHPEGETKWKRIKCGTCGCQAPDTVWNTRQQLAEQTSAEPYAYEVDNGECTELVYPAAIHKYKMFEEERITLELYTAPPSVEVLLEALRLAKVTFIANKMDVRNVMEVIDEALSSYKPTEG